MRIAVDISQVVYEGSGVARYTKNLIHSICKNDTRNKYTFFLSSLRKTIDKELKEIILQKHRLVEVKIPPTVLDFLWNRLHIVPIEKFVGKQDLVISSDWTQPPSHSMKITIVHDLISYKYPDELHPKTEFKLKELNVSSNIVAIQKRRLALVKKEVDCVIADSYATKKDLVDILHFDEKKITVIYPAVEVPKPDTKKIEGKTRDYILSVGKLEPRKNISKLIEAFQAANLPNTDLLIVGPKGWDDNKESKSENSNQNNIKFLGFVPDKKLYELYKHALFFIYPSLYEGFGYPVAEAMSLGCPVATSNTSSLKEIGKDAALLFDPQNKNEIVSALKKMTENKKLREELREKGTKRASLFSEKNFIAQFEKVLKSVSEN